jgi:hypothetical protein
MKTNTGKQLEPNTFMLVPVEYNGAIVYIGTLVTSGDDDSTPEFETLAEYTLKTVEDYGLKPVVLPKNLVSTQPETGKSSDIVQKRIGAIIKWYFEDEKQGVIPVISLYPVWNKTKTMGLYPITSVYFNQADAEEKIVSFNEWIAQLPNSDLTFDTLPQYGSEDTPSQPKPRVYGVVKKFEVYFPNYDTKSPEHNVYLTVKVKVKKYRNDKGEDREKYYFDSFETF